MKQYLNAPLGGFTLFELMIGMAIVGILASIATPNFIKFRDKARGELAITQMRIFEKEIENYLIVNGELPEDLSVIGMDPILDPWGRPYVYLRIAGSGVSEEDEAEDDNGTEDEKGKKGGKGEKKDKGETDDKGKKLKTRKDHSLHPINTDYDLFSVGKDGKSTAPLTAKISQDDIIRANNGGYVGLVSNY